MTLLAYEATREVRVDYLRPARPRSRPIVGVRLPAVPDSFAPREDPAQLRPAPSPFAQPEDAAPAAPEGSSELTGLFTAGGSGERAAIAPSPFSETAFAEGEVRWAPELPPGWVAAGEDPEVEVVGGGPPTYGAEPTVWPQADPDALDGLVPDTVLDGAQYGPLTVRTVAIRGDSARYRGAAAQGRPAHRPFRFRRRRPAAGGDGERRPRRGRRAPGRAGRGPVDRGRRGPQPCPPRGRPAAARRGSLKSGLHRLTDRCYGRLRARGEDLGLDDGAYTASVRCLLLPADPECRIRLFFGVATAACSVSATASGRTWTPAPDEASAPFRFRATVAQPGDALLMCSAGLAEPLRGEPQLAAHLADRWGHGKVPGLAAYLADAQTRVKGYADDRTAVTVWDA